MIPATLLPPVSDPITQPFGVISPTGHVHRGIDLASKTGTPCRVVQDGIVRVASKGNEGGYGFNAVVEHSYQGQPYATLYAHLASFKVTPGQRVMRGQVIALTDNTGLSTGPHLHFEVIDRYFRLYGGIPVNPVLYFGPALILRGGKVGIVKLKGSTVNWFTDGIVKRKIGSAAERAELCAAQQPPLDPNKIRVVSAATLAALPVVK